MNKLPTSIFQLGSMGTDNRDILLLSISLLCKHLLTLHGWVFQVHVEIALAAPAIGGNIRTGILQKLLHFS